LTFFFFGGGWCNFIWGGAKCVIFGYIDERTALLMFVEKEFYLTLIPGYKSVGRLKLLIMKRKHLDGTQHSTHRDRPS
jgi:hypothetical protein